VHAQEKEDVSDDVAGVPAYSCGLHTVVGIPKNSDRFLCRKTYAVGYNYTHQAPDWAAFYLNAYYVNLNLSSSNNQIQVDSAIPSKYRTKLFRFRKSSYVAGSILPQGAISVDRLSQHQSKLQSAAAPMTVEFYESTWSKLMLGFNHWTINFDGDVVGYTGTFFQPTDDKDRPFSHSSTIKADIPSYFFAIAYNIKSKESIAFLLPHEKIPFEDINKYRTSIDDIETLTGFNFFPHEKPEVAAIIKSRVNTTWNISSVLKLE
jgi:DNA/RNA endonuclease G (NUC1)